MSHFAPKTHEELLAILDDDETRLRAALEDELGRSARLRKRFELPGVCDVCREVVRFEVVRGADASSRVFARPPNWRETLSCPRCRLNNRQRLVAKEVRARAPEGAVVYAMEQVTPMYAWLRGLSGVKLHGSEYLGPDVQPGEVKDGIRHEDVTALSFADASVDVVVSNDVFEHVPDAEAGFREVARVLRPGGVLVMTIPFHARRAASSVRARLAGGKVLHLAPPEYHGNPVDPGGSLVFHDFGFDVLDVLGRAGLSAKVVAEWSVSYGHLGGPQWYFLAERPR